MCLLVGLGGAFRICLLSCVYLDLLVFMVWIDSNELGFSVLLLL